MNTTPSLSDDIRYLLTNVCHHEQALLDRIDRLTAEEIAARKLLREVRRHKARLEKDLGSSESTPPPEEPEESEEPEDEPLDIAKILRQSGDDAATADAIIKGWIPPAETEEPTDGPPDVSEADYQDWAKEPTETENVQPVIENIRRRRRARSTTGEES